MSGALYSEAEREAAIQRAAELAASEKRYLDRLRGNESLPVGAGCWLLGRAVLRGGAVCLPPAAA